MSKGFFSVITVSAMDGSCLSSLGSRHSEAKINPKRKLTIPSAASAPRQPITRTSDGAKAAATTPPAGTPVCLMPIAVARSSR